ncbi:MAG: thioredoxin family protein [Azonexus sp.]|nr:thioredoxin family protein [Azonexus sp.]
MSFALQTLRQVLIAGLLALSSLSGLAAGTDLPPAQDLRTEAERAAKAGGPLIVVFSRQDCKYCETVKRDYLKPLAADPRFRDRVVIRQVNQDSDAALVDFHGAATSHAQLAKAEKIKLVPVVAFYGPQGKRLAEPIIGARLPDFYPSYLEASVEKSSRALKAR